MNLCINPQCQNPNKNSDTMIFCQGCGSELLLDGRYRVLNELGQGGFATTYEVSDSNSHLLVLKVLMDNHPKYVELFQQEARVLTILNHPGIPKVEPDSYFLYFPNGREEPLHCLVMEKVEGLNLEQYIHQRGNRPLQPKRVLRWLAELSLILEKVHEHNFFHRDIKPTNIMLKANGSLVLIDFGTARELNQSYIKKQAVGEITGVVTAGYTPMEQMKGRAVLQSDFYALGGTAIFLLTAQNPSNLYSFADNRFNWHEAAPEVPTEFANLIDCLTAFSPTQRPRTAREIYNEVITIAPSLQGLEENLYSDYISYQPQRLQHPQSSLIDRSLQNTVFPTQSSSISEVTPEFIQRCCQELAEFIGPMATIVCKRALAQNPNLTKTELLETLAEKIANPQQAFIFKQRLS
ncbi:serine/threonine-protein kinase [Myxosarcina sp. GI1]|uniref:serine/threonine protein kinase n=1 Tax=Myxosarcina sp. GI1 TaxID=1541065 RepID=UPI0005600335|nr:serine/threonine-protein kinase [Myxosarcina sp. GI1]